MSTHATNQGLAPPEDQSIVHTFPTSSMMLLTPRALDIDVPLSLIPPYCRHRDNDPHSCASIASDDTASPSTVNRSCFQVKVHSLSLTASRLLIMCSLCMYLASRSDAPSLTSRTVPPRSALPKLGRMGLTWTVNGSRCDGDEARTPPSPVLWRRL